MLTLAYAAALILAAALDRAWPQPLRLGVVGPDLALVLVACIGIARGPVAGCASGLFGGFLVASAGGGSFGAVLVSYIAVGLLCGKAKGRVFADHILAAPVIAAVSTLVGEFVQLVIVPPPAFFPWLGEAARALVFNVPLSPLAYLYARAVSRRWPQRIDT